MESLKSVSGKETISNRANIRLSVIVGVVCAPELLDAVALVVIEIVQSNYCDGSQS
jgi:hypothetical protein